MEKKKLIPRVVISLPVSPGDRSRRSGTAGNHLKDKKSGMKKKGDNKKQKTHSRRKNRNKE